MVTVLKTMVLYRQSWISSQAVYYHVPLALPDPPLFPRCRCQTPDGPKCPLGTVLAWGWWLCRRELMETYHCSGTEYHL